MSTGFCSATLIPRNGESNSRKPGTLPKSTKPWMAQVGASLKVQTEQSALGPQIPRGLPLRHEKSFFWTVNIIKTRILKKFSVFDVKQSLILTKNPKKPSKNAQQNCFFPSQKYLGSERGTL